MKRAAKSTSQITKKYSKHNSRDESSINADSVRHCTGKFLALCIACVCFLFVGVLGDGDCVV